jgi:RNA polymerase sigma-70 factor (ECF subfamily)
MTTSDETLEQAHRLWFGRLVGWLFRMTGDLQLAEDAVAAAFASALTSWREQGAPESPEAWLRVASRNQAMSALRRSSRLTRLDESLADVDSTEGTGIDERLTLLFVCAHPAIDPRMHAPLMLQTVLGVDAARISSVFLVPPSTMGQRLSRAKGKIRDAGIRYAVPEAEEFPARLGAVLQAVYGAYGLADPTADGADDRDDALREEAVRLSQLLTELLPRSAEAWGLHALLLHTESRRGGRVVDGCFVPLGQQDTTLWSGEQRARADASLRSASRLGGVGRFQLEAAISAIHSARADGVATDWHAIAVLYRGLLEIAPSVGAVIGAASALIETGERDDAARLLDSLPAEAVRTHQPYWVCRARLARVSGDAVTARRAAEMAIGLTSDPAIRGYLVETLRESAQPSTA